MMVVPATCHSVRQWIPRCLVIWASQDSPESRPSPARRTPRGPWNQTALQGAERVQDPRAVLTCNQMVVGELTETAVDDLFHALADATRRDILRRCAQDEPSVSRLAETYPMSFAAVQKHVAVLERAGLVTKERRGREQRVRTDLEAVRRAREALDELELAWRGRVDRMSQVLAAKRGDG